MPNTVLIYFKSISRCPLKYFLPWKYICFLPLLWMAWRYLFIVHFILFWDCPIDRGSRNLCRDLFWHWMVFNLHHLALWRMDISDSFSSLFRQSFSVKLLFHSTELIPLRSTECHKRYSVEFTVYTMRNKWERRSGMKTCKFFCYIFCFGHPPRQLSFLLEVSNKVFRVFQDLCCMCLGYCRTGDTNESQPNYWTFFIVLAGRLAKLISSKLFKTSCVPVSDRRSQIPIKNWFFSAAMKCKIDQW